MAEERKLKKALNFQRYCFEKYLKDIQEQFPRFPNPYMYPDGNPVRPVVPVQTRRESIMLVGAFPSARFERRNGRLIPVGNNLSPFGIERYFYGREIRTQASRDSLE